MSSLITIPFRGDTLWATRVDGIVFVAVKPICEALGIAACKQIERLKRDPVLAEGATMMVVPSSGGVQETVCLRLDLLNGWLFTIAADRVRPEARDKVLAYKRECYRVLYEHFHAAPMAVPETPDHDETEEDGTPEYLCRPLAEIQIELAMVREARLIYGAARARVIWRQTRLPQVEIREELDAAARDDAEPALRWLLNTPLGPDETTIGALLCRLGDAELGTAEELALKGRLLQIGISVSPMGNPGRVVVSNNHPGLTRLFRTSPWRSGWHAALIQIPGAQRQGLLRYGRHRSRGISLDLDTVLPLVEGRTARIAA